MKDRDAVALATFRTALSAIDNAEAVPAGEQHRAGAIEHSRVGVGRADVERRSLSEAQMRAIVRQEAQERLAAADSLTTANPDASRQLRHEAGLLLALLDERVRD